MPTYVCRVGMGDGAIVTRAIDAPDESALRAEVARLGARLFSVKVAGDAGVSGATGGAPSLTSVLARLVPRRGRSVKAGEFLVFNQELVALLKAGLPIVNGFEILLERQENPRFKAILKDVRDQLVSGVALSDAFLSHGDVFPRLYATSLKAGERSGEIEKVLRRYLAYQKILGGIRRKVTGALVYPAVLIALSIGLVTILMTYVIPKFREFFAGFQAGQLPLITRLVIGTADFLHAHFLVIAGAIAVGGVMLSRWKASDSGSIAWDGFLLRLPLVGAILQQFALSQFSRSLATLVGAGTPLVPALEIASGAVANRRVSGAVAAVVPRVREGSELWRSLEETGIFTSLAVEMIKVGEATGALEEMLTNVSDFYDEAIEARLQRIVTLIEPIILVVMGGVIAMILLSIYLPMFTILSNIRG
ncbi:MAG TPA: type II secretion system F family protein [Thermoanaerobaculia bacterium]|nr:type II secretion system F family protein [Thermoanaerobaculia bacterium]